jgi:hypothetical protein
MVTKGSNSKKWVIRSFMLLLVLAAYGGTAVGNRNVIKVAEATESEGETFVLHEINETRRESTGARRHREHRHGEIDRYHAQPDFRRHGRLWFVNEHFKVREAFGPSSPPRAPPVLS